MSDQLLNILKYFLVALLWLFFVRVLSAVWAEVRKGGAATAAGSEPPPVPGRAADGGGRWDGGEGARPGGRAARPVKRPPVPAPSRPVATRSGARSVAARPDRSATALRLKVLEPAEHWGRSFELGDEVTVGRAAGCGVQLDGDSFTSQVHARLYRRQGELWVEDLGSTNGTYLNDRKLAAPALLHEGDHLKVGRTVLEVTG